MTNSYLAALRQGMRQRLEAIADGSGDVENVVTMVCEEVEHAYARGHLVALHLREKETQSGLPTPTA